MKDSHARSVIKGITWRITGTIDTMIMAFIVTGQISNAIKIGFTEVFTKIVLYYFHERLWNLIKFGRKNNQPTHARSLIKGVSWRAVGTMDTIVVSYFITGHLFNSLKIGGLEVFSKIALYYLHERIWARIKWGRIFNVSADGSTEVQVNNPVETEPVTNAVEVKTVAEPVK
jgi:uncharacterized membrane protein